jgi:undecaprenyl-diphosphatase
MSAEPGADRRDAATSLGALVVAASLFAIVARNVGARETEALDQRVRAWMRGHRTEVGDRIAAPVKVASMPAVVVPAALLAAWWVWRRRGGRPALALVAAPALAAAAGLACSTLLAQRNPPDAADAPHGEVSDPSFPSGHTTGVTAEALSVAFVLSREGLASPGALAALVGWPVVVGVTRVYRDRHWATDVIGGWASGTAVAAACWLIYTAAG